MSQLLTFATANNCSSSIGASETSAAHPVAQGARSIKHSTTRLPTAFAVAPATTVTQAITLSRATDPFHTIYDGDGRRIKRIVNGVETWQVYGLGGELIAEYSAGGAPSSPQKEYGYRNGQLLITVEPSANIHWLVTDHLGTPRMVFDQTGSLANVSRHDYLPFGEELFAGTGGRTTAQSYSASDGVRQHFTLKERDNETGLDYFLARYYSSAQGRFTSPDKPFADQFQANPQSWNTYSYVRNSPCNNIDAKGRCSAPSGLKPGQVGICIEAFIAKRLFKGVALGDNRTFSGDNKDLTARFKTHIIVSQAPDDARKVNVSQTTEPGISRVITPLAIAPIVSAPGTAETSLNGVKSGSDGTSQTTVTADSAGVSRFNVSTNAENGFSAVYNVGTISTSINFEVNVNNPEVLIDAESAATAYPSIAIYSYAFVNGKMVTTRVLEQPEGSPDALTEPMKPLPDQTQRKP